MKKLFSLILFMPWWAVAQYAPPAGYAGTTAIHKDSTVFVNWATQCVVIRGWQDISDTSLGYTSAGDDMNGTGKAMDNSVVSLGDGGMAILSFPVPIVDGTGADFAVFENAFNDSFLELAHVEVSSDGKQFFRFASQCVGDTLSQYTNNAFMDATKLNNLAGKYRAGYGTPFDLSELKGNVGLDVQHITHVKLIDAIGSLNPKYATRDSKGNPINDPWPTPFATGGFDLDAVGVMHEGSWKLGAGNTDALTLNLFQGLVYPNPCGNILNLGCQMSDASYSFINLAGEIILNGTVQRENAIDLHHLPAGIYILKVESKDFSAHVKVVKQ